ncbi:hypothetical protein LTR08_007907 [Meristemomyces frigidus]|nr:hypothetical protein LTR08_007907 [Meristemomyces frigidus]
MSHLNGLKLTFTERLVVVALSAPILYARGKALVQYWRGLTAEARRGVADDGRQRERQAARREREREQQTQAAQH